MDKLPVAATTVAERISVEDEASKMSRGNSRQLVGVVVGAVALLGVGLLSLQMMGRTDAYSQAVAAAGEIERVHFDGFLDCVLPHSRPSVIGAGTVSAALQRMSDRLGDAYGKTLQACQPRVQALGSSLDALSVPSSAAPQHAKLVAAAGALAAANTRYSKYLSAGDQDRDQGSASPMATAFGEASATYATAQLALRQALEQKL